MGVAIQKLAEEDPTFTVELDPETGQTVIGGMGELHLDIIVDRMRREFKVEANVGKPMVAYRETIKRQSRRSSTRTRSRPVAPASSPRSSSTSSRSPVKRARPTSSRAKSPAAASRASTSRRSTPAAQDAMQSGVLAGYPMVDIKATLLDGAYHEVDSSEMAFKVAGSMALKEAAKKANPVLLEPIMAVEVRTPEEYMGDVIGDLNSRRGQIQAMDEQHGARVVKAHVPLSEMFGYVGDLRSKTQGRANYSMVFDSYSEVPANVSKEIIAKATGE